VPFHRVDNRIEAVRIGTALPVRDVTRLTCRLKAMHIKCMLWFESSRYRQMSGCGARTVVTSLEAVFESSDVERFGWILMEV
jgi:hypothetical protein